VNAAFAGLAGSKRRTGGVAAPFRA